MVDSQTICHDIAVALLAKSSVSSPEEAVKLYDELLPKVQAAYESAHPQNGSTSKAKVIDRLW